MEMMTLPVLGESTFERGGIERDLKFHFDEFALLLSERFLTEREGEQVISIESLLAFLENAINLNDQVQNLSVNPIRASSIFQQNGSFRALTPRVTQKEIDTLLSSKGIVPSFTSIVEIGSERVFLETSDSIPSKGLSSQNERLISSIIKTQENILNFYFQSLFWEKQEGNDPIPCNELGNRHFPPIDHLNLNSENPAQSFIVEGPLISPKDLINLNQGREKNSNQFILDGDPTEIIEHMKLEKTDPLLPNPIKTSLPQLLNDISISNEIPVKVQMTLPLKEEVIESDSLRDPNPVASEESFIPNDQEEEMPSFFEFKMKTIANDDSKMIDPLNEAKLLYEDEGRTPFSNIKGHPSKEPLFNHSIESPKVISSSFKEMANPPLPSSLKMDPFEIYQQISKQILWSIKNNGERIKITLDPPQLGNLLLEIDRDKGNIRTTIWAENPVTKEILEHHQIQLEKILSGEGFRLEKFEVLLQQDMGTLHQREDPVEDRRQAQRRYKGKAFHAPLDPLEIPQQGMASLRWGSLYVDLFV